LDGFSVVVDGTVLRDADLANRRARTLLKLLAVGHGRPVSLDRVINVLTCIESRPQGSGLWPRVVWLRVSGRA
jgi:hypothetical protein